MDNPPIIFIMRLILLLVWLIGTSERKPESIIQRVKVVKIIVGFFLSLVGLIACDSESSTSPDGKTGPFTPPTAYYYRIDDVSSSVSGDAPKASLGTGDFRLTKAFVFSSTSTLGGSLHMVCPSNSTIAKDLAEGGIKEVYISEFNRSGSSDSVQLNLIVGTFDLNAITGKVYLSKKNGILRFTSDGKITLTGFDLVPPKAAQTRTLEFSVENGISF